MTHKPIPINPRQVAATNRPNDLQRKEGSAPKHATSSKRRQGVFWLLTVPDSDFTTKPSFTISLPTYATWIRGQQELGESGYLHWQVIIAFKIKQSLVGVQGFLPGIHAELSKSDAANDYVWKDATRVEGTQFEYGTKPICRNSKPDWECIWAAAKLGDIMAIPASIRVVRRRH